LRLYDVYSARWLTRDPIGYDGGQNLYGYVSGNPVMAADPFGTQDQTNSVTNASGMRTQLSILRETDSTPIRFGDASRIIGITAAQQWWQRWGQWTSQQWQRFGSMFGGKGGNSPGNSDAGFSAEEAAIANYLRNCGRIVYRNPLEGASGAGRQGDAIVDGITHEFKTLDPGATANTIRNVLNASIKHGGQARNMVIDARGSGLNCADAIQGAYRALGISRGKIDRLTIIGDNYFWGASPKK